MKSVGKRVKRVLFGKGRKLPSSGCRGTHAVSVGIVWSLRETGDYAVGIHRRLKPGLESGHGGERALPSNHSSFCSQERLRHLGGVGVMAAWLTGFFLLQAVSWAYGK